MNLLDIRPGTGDNVNNFVFTENSEAFIYALIGFALVFVGIIIIIAIIWLIGLIMRKTDNLAFLTKRKDRVKEIKEVSESPVAADEEGDEVSPEIKAAIVAAIMAYYKKEVQPQSDFVVKRIKRL